MAVVPDLSALFRVRPTSETTRENKEEKVILTNWDIVGGSHPAFDSNTGEYVVPKDALYAVCVQIVPSDGRAPVSRQVLHIPRAKVDYVVRIVEPPRCPQTGDGDDVDEEFLDVGQRSFGELLHLRKGTKVSVMALASAGGNSLRLKIEMVQRKRKRSPQPQLSAREMKKLEKKRRRETQIQAPPNSSLSAVAPPSDPIAGVETTCPEPDCIDTCAKCGDGADRTGHNGSHAEGDGSDEDNKDDDDAWSAQFSSDDTDAENAEDRQDIGRISKKLRSASTKDAQGGAAPQMSKIVG